MSHITFGSRITLFASAIVLAVSSPTHAQDPMAKWKPNVGDRFICAVSHQCNCGADDFYYGTDTIRFEITKTDSFFDASRRSVVVASKEYLFSFLDHFTATPVVDTGSDYTIGPASYSINSGTIESSLSAGVIAPDSMWPYQFSIVKDTLIPFQNGTVNGIFLQTPLSTWGSEASMIFDTSLGWFLSYEGNNYAHSDQITRKEERWRFSLLQAMKVPRTVRGIPTEAIPKVLADRQNIFLEYSFCQCAILLDPLGRPVRSWQLAAGDGPREITLNVADVPSGVYFVRLQGGGMDEVKRVAIIR